MSWHSRILSALRTPFALLLLLAYAFVFLALYLMEPRPIELRIGTFAGSNWDVPQGESYAYLDHVIARFEAEHPGVKVTYQSGIRKSDYTEWLAGRELAGEMPDVFLIPQDDTTPLRGARRPCRSMRSPRKSGR